MLRAPRINPLDESDGITPARDARTSAESKAELKKESQEVRDRMLKKSKERMDENNKKLIESGLGKF